MTRISRIKNGSSAVRKYPDRPMGRASRFVQDTDDRGKSFFREERVATVSITLSEKRKQHSLNHPNDKNSNDKQKGVYWGKKGFRDRQLTKFYKEHIYTFVDENDLSKKEWVRISGFTEEEQ